jgi:hypothetical protein
MPLVPHAPRLEYQCDDYECCPNGCPTVTCRACAEEWPCTDWQSRHTESQIRAQDRYVARKVWGRDTHMIEYVVRTKAAKRR